MHCVSLYNWNQDNRDTVLPLWLWSHEEIVYRELVLAYLWASQGCGKCGHAAGRGCCRMQPLCYSPKKANSLVCTSGCLMNHIPRHHGPAVASFPLPYPWSFLLLHILNQNLIALVFLEDLAWDPICVYYTGTRLLTLQWVETGAMAFFSHLFLSVYNLTALYTVSKEVPGSGFVGNWGRQNHPSPLEPELQESQVLVPCQLLHPAILPEHLWQPASCSGTYGGKHTSTSLELPVYGAVSLLARHPSWVTCQQWKRWTGRS